MSDTVAVVTAAGSGERLGAGFPKAFVEFGGCTMLERAVDGVLASGVLPLTAAGNVLVLAVMAVGLGCAWLQYLGVRRLA